MNNNPSSPTKNRLPTKNLPSQIRDTVASAAMIMLVLTSDPQQSMASTTAGQISLNNFPPSNLEINAKEIPIVGNIISGTYSKLEKNAASPSVSISLPKDKIEALKSVILNGHVELDVNGLLSTHLDVDIGSNEAGAATVRVASPLIPKLPFKNSVSRGELTVLSPSNKASDWSKVVNLGNGNPYYWNSKTGETTYDAPDKI